MRVLPAGSNQHNGSLTFITAFTVLEPVCRRLGMNLIASVGYLSITSVVDLLKRIVRANKPARIFYISDFDPSGEGMPIAVARQCEFWLSEYAPGADIKLVPIALTSEQVAEYDLPRAPIKDTDTSKETFEDQYGAGAVELDALEELRPGELARLLDQTAAPYVDHQLPIRLADARDAADQELTTVWEEETEREQAKLNAIERESAQIAAQYREELQRLATALDNDLDPLRARLDSVWQSPERQEHQPQRRASGTSGA